MTKEVKVTDSFLGLKEEVKGCQSLETVTDCETKSYLESLRQNCGCIPFSLGENKMVETGKVKETNK